MGVTIRHGFPEEQRAAVAALFWGAFGDKLGRVLGPPLRGQAFVARVVQPEFALSAQGQGGELLGIAGFKTASGGLVGGTMRDLATIYGWPQALWRGPLLSLLERDLAADCLLMDGIFVSAQARGQGVGTALLRAVMTEAKARGMARVRLDVIDSNPRARALYEREGFVAIAEEGLGPLRHIFGFRSATRMERVLP
jgi:ribosomal protein S18 acetylase RimI-like enzyme